MPKKSTQKTTPQKAQEESLIIENSKVTVTLPWSSVEPAYNKVLNKAAQHVKADGFRKGKVPPAMAEKMISQQALFEETLQQVLPPAYSKVIQDLKKLPITRPEIEPVEMEKGKDWVLNVYFAEQQPVELGKYQAEVKAVLKDAEKEVKELETKLKAEKKEITEHQKEDIQLKHVFQKLIASIKPKVQELLVREEVNRQVQTLVDQLRQLNLKVEDYLKSRQMTGQQLQQEYAASALTSLQLEFILAEIAKDLKLTVVDKEIEETLDKIADGKLPVQQKQNPDYRSYIFSTLLKQKVVKHLLAL